MPDVFGAVGDLLGSGVKAVASGVLDPIGKWLWSGGLEILRIGVGLADRFGTVNLDIHSGPLAAVWPVTLPIGAAIGAALFYFQLATVTAKGGRGLLRSVSGAGQFGVALAASAVMFAALVAVSDSLCTFILNKGLASDSFESAFSHTGFSDAAANAVKGAALAVLSLFGVIPIGIGFAFENVMRAATIYLLVAVIPITAAGLVAGTTSSWYWRTSNWLMAAIAMKPVMALALWLGVAIAGAGQGLAALIVGLAVLFVALFAPLALFRLFAFTSERATDAFKGAWSGSGAGDAVGNAGSQVSEMVTGSQTTSSMESSTDARYDSSASSGTDAGSSTSSHTSTADTDSTAGEEDQNHGGGPLLTKDDVTTASPVSVPQQSPPSEADQSPGLQQSASQQPGSPGQQRPARSDNGSAPPAPVVDSAGANAAPAPAAPGGGSSASKPPSTPGGGGAAAGGGAEAAVAAV